MADLSPSPKPERVARFDLYRRVALLASLAFAMLLCASLMTGRDYAITPPLPLTLLGLCIVSLLAVLLTSTVRHGLKVLWLALVLAPAGFVAFVAVVVLSPVVDEMTQVRLPDGRTAHLSIDPAVFTDTSYSLWISSPTSIFWRRPPPSAQLSYSEDGSYVGQEKLRVSRDGKRLLVGRGGVWTDCLDITQDFDECDDSINAPWWSDADYHTKMRAHSDALERMGR